MATYAYWGLTGRSLSQFSTLRLDIGGVTNVATGATGFSSATYALPPGYGWVSSVPAFINVDRGASDPWSVGSNLQKLFRDADYSNTNKTFRIKCTAGETLDIRVYLGDMTGGSGTVASTTVRDADNTSNSVPASWYYNCGPTVVKITITDTNADGFINVELVAGSGFWGLCALDIAATGSLPASWYTPASIGSPPYRLDFGPTVVSASPTYTGFIGVGSAYSSEWKFGFTSYFDMRDQGALSLPYGGSDLFRDGTQMPASVVSSFKIGNLTPSTAYDLRAFYYPYNSACYGTYVFRDANNTPNNVSKVASTVSVFGLVLTITSDSSGEIRVESYNSGVLYWCGLDVYTTGNLPSAPLPVPITSGSLPYRIDMGSGPVQSGALPSPVAYDNDLLYGFTTTPLYGSIDRGSASGVTNTNFYRDLIAGNGGGTYEKYKVAVPTAGGTYVIRGYFGDAGNFCNGNYTFRDADNTGNSTAFTVASNFQQATLTITDSNNDGFIIVEATSSGAAFGWIGLDIDTQATGLPTAWN